MPPSSTVHGGQYDTKYVTFEQLTRAAFVADTIWGVWLEPACTRIQSNLPHWGQTMGVFFTYGWDSFVPQENEY